MKEKIASFIEAIKSKIDAAKNKISSHYDIGMAVHEEDEHDELTEKRASTHKHNFKEKLAVAESTKERIIEKLRGNLVYIVIAVLIIVPGVFKLIGFFQTPDAPSTQIAKGTPFGETAQTASIENKQIPEDTFETLLAQQGQLPPSASDFAESAPPEEVVNSAAVPEEAAPEEAVNTTPVPEAAAPEEAVNTTPVPESVPPEEPINTAPVQEFAPAPVSEAKPDKETTDKEGDDSRSMLANLFTFGDGSEETSDNIAKEKAVPAENASTTVASIPGAAPTVKSQTADQILQSYAAQESKIEDQLNKLLSRMDKLEENVAAVSEIEERLAAIENNNQIAADQQLQIVQTKLAELEQGIKQINQQAAKVVAPVANTQSLPQNNVAATSQETNVIPAITVEAVIPGRAWIRNQDGVLMVVQVGDDINGVGKVTRIDAREGTVATATHIFRQ